MAQFFIDRPIFAWVIAHPHHAGRRARRSSACRSSQYPAIAPPAISINATLPRRVGEDARGHGHAGDRAAHERARQPALHGVVERLGRQRARSTLTFDAGTEPRHRAGAGAEQAAARDAAAAAGGAAAGRARREVGRELPAHRRLRLRGRQHDPQRHRRLRRTRTLQDPISRVPGVGEVQRVRLAVRDAHLARPGQAHATTGSRRSTSQRAVQAQNAQVSAGQLGGAPGGRRASSSPPPSPRRPGSRRPSSSAAILLRVNPDGSQVRLGDVARVELGGENSEIETYVQRQPVVRHRRSGSPPARTRSQTADAVRARRRRAVAVLPARAARSSTRSTRRRSCGSRSRRS